VQHGVNKFAQNGAPQSRRQTEQWQMLDETIASASINEIRVLPQKHSPGVGGLSNAMVVVASRAQQTCRIQQCGAVQPLSQPQPGETAPVFCAQQRCAKAGASIRGRPLRLFCSLAPAPGTFIGSVLQQHASVS